MNLADLLATGQPIVADGGMGTMLFSAGLPQGEAPEAWNLSAPEQVQAIHAAYIAAGAQIILSNTFGGNRLRLEMHDNLAAQTAAVNEQAALLARRAAEAAPHPVLVAGSMGPTGGIMEPYGVLSPAEARAIFQEQAAALIAGGVDLLWIETMSALEEVQAAVTAIRQLDPAFPIVATMTFDTHEHTMMGVSPAQAVEALARMGVNAAGANCGNGPAEVEAVISKMQAAGTKLPLVAKANAGLPRLEDDIAIYDATPETMAAYARQVRQNGASIIGACCGSTPAHIAAIAAALA